MLVEKVIDTAAGIIDKVIPDKAEAARHKHELSVLRLEAEKEAIKGQLEANIEASKHPSRFVAGARPAVIWALLAILLYNYIGYSLLLYAGSFYPAMNVEAFPKPIGDTEQIFYLIGGLLGMGGWRSWDKRNGAARNNLAEK